MGESQGHTAEVKIVVKRHERIECENCGELAVYKNTYLDERNGPARYNSASSAYRRDDCSFCSDHDQFLCGDCHQHKYNLGVPDGFCWCATFTYGETFKHLFLEWRDEECPELLAALKALSAVAEMTTFSDQYPRECEAARAAIAAAEGRDGQS